MSSTKATSQCRRGSKACQAKVIHKCPPRLLGFDGQLRCLFACLQDPTLDQQTHHWNPSALPLTAAPSPGSLQNSGQTQTVLLQEISFKPGNNFLWSRRDTYDYMPIVTGR